MKFIQYKQKNSLQIGILHTPQNKISPIQWKNNTPIKNMLSLINNFTHDNITILHDQTIELSTVQICSPITHPKHDVICIGLNYKEHADEANNSIDFQKSPNNDSAVYFSKRANRILGSGEEVKGIFEIDPKMDYETELAVVIGKTAHKVGKEDVEKYIFGYSILNDFSSRGLQSKHKQWYLGKSVDNYTVMGPCIVSRDEFSFPLSLELRGYVNGELRQKSNTANMIWDISTIISELSEVITLEPGDIIATGTPSGVGMGFVPPRYLRAGDLVCCEIEGIGVLESRIV